MKLNAFNMSDYTCCSNRYSFKGQNTSKPVSTTNANTSLKRVAPWVFSGMLLLGGNSCSEDKRVSDFERYKGITVEYANVSQQTRDSVMAPVFALQNRLSKENNFLNGVKFDIVNSFKSMDGNDSFKEYVRNYESNKSYKGTSFYSDSLIPKRVAVQEIAFDDKKQRYKAMRQTVMHEVGHHFDNYYGHDHNADFAQKWDSIMYNRENSIESDLFTFRTIKDGDKKIETYYYSNNALSDKEEFQNALLNDINRRGTTVVVATHAKEIVDKMQKRVIAIENGTVCSDIKKGVYINEHKYN